MTADQLREDAKQFVSSSTYELVDGEELIERFKMRVDGEVWPVSINHTKRAVRINGVVLMADQWPAFVAAGPEMARAVIRTAKALDGTVE